MCTRDGRCLLHCLCTARSLLDLDALDEDLRRELRITLPPELQQPRLF